MFINSSIFASVLKTPELVKKIKYLNLVVVTLLALSYLMPTVVSTTLVFDDLIEQTTSESSDMELLKEDLTDSEITAPDECLVCVFPHRYTTLDYLVNQAPKEPVIQQNTPPPQVS